MAASSGGLPRFGAGAEALGECGSRARAVALAQEVLSLHEAHEKKLEENRKCIEDLEGQVDQLSKRNEELERELAELKSQLPSQAASGGAEQPDNANNILGCTDDSVFLGEKGQFIQFVLALANGGKSSKEYKQMYQFLLKCFTDADNNFDGRVGYLEFEMLIDAAAFLPRRFGYAPSTPELYATDFDRVKLRLALFNGLKPKKAKAVNKKSGTYDYISFHTWLNYAIGHITEKAASLTDEKPHSTILKGGEEYQAFILKAVESRKTREYKEFYHYVLKCFVEADKDLDGQVDKPGLNSLMDAEGPRLFGFSPTALEEEYRSPEEKEEARDKLFQSLDPDGSGLISFDMWLEYIYTHICAKSKNIGAAGAVPEVEAAGAALSEPQCPWRV
uniref:EF-hand domain-containing protein n=1 Tax=Pyrodinium bahamense TaxID=73915 RepID=A0A7S0FRF0_9DINO